MVEDLGLWSCCGWGWGCDCGGGAGRGVGGLHLAVGEVGVGGEGSVV